MKQPNSLHLLCFSRVIVFSLIGFFSFSFTTLQSLFSISKHSNHFYPHFHRILCRILFSSHHNSTRMRTLRVYILSLGQWNIDIKYVIFVSYDFWLTWGFSVGNRKHSDRKRREAMLLLLRGAGKKTQKKMMKEYYSKGNRCEKRIVVPS